MVSIRRVVGFCLWLACSDVVLAEPIVWPGESWQRATPSAVGLTEAELKKAIELNPLHPVAHNELGIIYRKTGRFAEARSSYEAALSIYPGYHHARKNLAILCDLYLSDPQCAMDNYEAYMETVPNDAEVDIWMADLRIRMGQ